MQVIVISGNAQEAGKDTTALLLKKYLTEKGKKVEITHFAKRLKEIAVVKFPEYKENIRLKDKIGRKILQLLGTDLYRETVDENFWVNQLDSDIKNNFKDIDVVIVPDTRFPNEVDWALNKPTAMHLHVNNPRKTPSEHKSEGQINTYRLTYVLNNSETIDYLEQQILRIMKDWEKNLLWG